MKKRLSWPEYAMLIAHIVKLRSQDPNHKVGACILRADHSIASVGYNGAPPGAEIDWSNRQHKNERVIHAETNALRYIQPGEGKLIAITLSPCLPCLMNIISYGIKEIYYDEDYRDVEKIITIAKEFDIDIKKLTLASIVEKYPNLFEDFLGIFRDKFGY